MSQQYDRAVVISNASQRVRISSPHKQDVFITTTPLKLSSQQQPRNRTFGTFQTPISHSKYLDKIDNEYQELTALPLFNRSIQTPVKTDFLTYSQNLEKQKKRANDKFKEISERVRNAVLSNKVLAEKIEKFPQRITSVDIITTVISLNLSMTQLQAKEAILYACSCTEQLNLFNLERLMAWLTRAILTNDIKQKQQKIFGLVNRRLSDDQKFQNILNYTASAVKRDRKLQQQVIADEIQLNQTLMNESFRQGILSSKQARIRLVSLKKRELQERQTNIDLILNNEKCLKAMQIEKFLTRSWRDDQKNWLVATKLTEKDRKYVNDLIKYGPPRKD